MSIRFEPDPRGVTQMLMSSKMQDAMVEVAESAAAYARSISPVDSGTYRDSFDVERAEFSTTRGGTRKGARLVNDAPHAAAVEWGQGRHILGQTLARIESK